MSHQRPNTHPNAWRAQTYPYAAYPMVLDSVDESFDKDAYFDSIAPRLVPRKEKGKEGGDGNGRKDGKSGFWVDEEGQDKASEKSVGCAVAKIYDEQASGRAVEIIGAPRLERSKFSGQTLGELIAEARTDGREKEVFEQDPEQDNVSESSDISIVPRIITCASGYGGDEDEDNDSDETLYLPIIEPFSPDSPPPIIISPPGANEDTPKDTPKSPASLTTSDDTALAVTPLAPIAISPHNPIDAFLTRFADGSNDLKSYLALSPSSSSFSESSYHSTTTLPSPTHALLPRSKSTFFLPGLLVSLERKLPCDILFSPLNKARSPTMSVLAESLGDVAYRCTMPILSWLPGEESRVIPDRVAQSVVGTAGSHGSEELIDEHSGESESEKKDEHSEEHQTVTSSSPMKQTILGVPILKHPHAYSQALSFSADDILKVHAAMDKAASSQRRVAAKKMTSHCAPCGAPRFLGAGSMKALWKGYNWSTPFP